MAQYGLGPNGGILTSLNLFATRFDQARARGCVCVCVAPVLHRAPPSVHVARVGWRAQAELPMVTWACKTQSRSSQCPHRRDPPSCCVPLSPPRARHTRPQRTPSPPQVVSLVERPRAPRPRYVLVDTPGQIEIFAWSASGSIICDGFASAFPTVVLFVVDTPRAAAPQAFVSNMLQVRVRAACALCAACCVWGVLGDGCSSRVRVSHVRARALKPLRPCIHTLTCNARSDARRPWPAMRARQHAHAHKRTHTL